MDPKKQQERDEEVQNNLVNVNFNGQVPLPESPNRQIPPDVWRRLQNAGSQAADRLLDMLKPSIFERLNDKDKIALLKVTFETAYKQQDINKHLHIHTGKEAPDDTAEGNVLTKMASSARRSLPEFSRGRLSDQNAANVTIDHDPLHSESGKDTSDDWD